VFQLINILMLTKQKAAILFVKRYFTGSNGHHINTLQLHLKNSHIKF